MLFLHSSCLLCDWWWLGWLLLPIIGWLLYHWWQGAQYRSRIEALENELSASALRSGQAYSELEDCRKQSKALKSEILALKTSGAAAQKTGSQFSGSTGNTSSASQNMPADSGISVGAKGSSSAPSRKIGAFASVPSDNLQLIEGIGPKMETILKDKGIRTWSELAGRSPDQLRSILDSFGDQYRIIDPSTWPTQAQFAKAGDFTGLMQFQKSGGSDSKAEKAFIKMGLLRQWNRDDLKAIEGIGPKIAALLEAEGIDSWEKLAAARVETLSAILEKAGSRFQLADPGTWPRQAAMAAKGDFEALRQYQEELKWGRE